MFHDDLQAGPEMIGPTISMQSASHDQTKRTVSRKHCYSKVLRAVGARKRRPIPQ